MGCLFEIHETAGTYRAVQDNRTLNLYLRRKSDTVSRKIVMEKFYKNYLKKEVSRYIEKYESEMKVKVTEYGFSKMKTRWGSCNYGSRRIWINLDLVNKPANCLEFLVVHEMVHLVESYHNSKFKSLMDRYSPQLWQVQVELNCQQVRHDEWGY